MKTVSDMYKLVGACIKSQVTFNYVEKAGKPARATPCPVTTRIATKTIDDLAENGTFPAKQIAQFYSTNFYSSSN